MLRTLLWVSAAGGAAILLTCVACVTAQPWRRELANPRLDERVAVDLEGVATAGQDSMRALLGSN